MPDDLSLSRPLATAQRLGDLAPDRHRFHQKPVLLTGEQKVLSTENGVECLLTSLRLLVRVTSQLTVSIPDGLDDLRRDCRTLSDHITFGNGIVEFGKAADLNHYDAILCVGSKSRPELPWTVINSQGWLARVSSGPIHLPSDCTQTNPIAAMAAAALGVSEVFKRLLKLKESRARVLNGLAFSLESYRCGEVHAGLPLPKDMRANLLLAGVGAIGNGIVHLLGRLPITGTAWVVDAQKYRQENLGTCILIGPHDIGSPKAIFAADALGKRFQAIGFPEEIAQFRDRLGRDVPYPGIVLNGLDNVDARNEVQGIWPDLLLDGAIGDFPCQVSRHRWGEDSACLSCLFRQTEGESAEQVQSRSTGLSITRVRQFDDLVTEDDVQSTAPDKQGWLRKRIGRQVCSVVREGVAQQLSEEKQRGDFQPSVPFVACMSASLVVAELVKFIAGWPTALETRFQFDLLRGPEIGQMFPQNRRHDCDCVARAENIEKWRKSRALAISCP